MLILEDGWGPAAQGPSVLTQHPVCTRAEKNSPFRVRLWELELRQVALELCHLLLL